MAPDAAPDLDAIATRLAEHVRLVGPLTVESESESPERRRRVITDGAQRWIVRVPRNATGAARLVVEDDLLSHLSDTAIPVPVPVVSAMAADGLDAFDVVTLVRGLRIRDRLPLALPRTSTTRHDLSAGMVDVLIRLHNLDIEEAELDASAVPQPAERLAALRQRIADLGITSAATSELVGRLEVSVPPASPVSLVHGAFHINRLIVEPDDPRRVAGIVGWGSAGAGDPLFELGVLLALWAEDADEPVTTWLPWTMLTTDDGFFSRSTVTHEYMVRSRHDLRHLEWYVELGYLRLICMAAESGEVEALAAIDPMARQAVTRADHSGISGLAGG